MPQTGTIRVKGLREFIRATDRCGKAVKKEVRLAFQDVGETVRRDWSAAETRFGIKTATGLRTKVRQRGISVEQTRRKTTGKRPDFGRTQQRIGDEILEAKTSEVEVRFEQVLDRVAAEYER